MKNQTHFAPTLDDIIFDGRNKSYGAYFLRQHADRYMTMAMFSAIFFFVLAFFSPKIIQLIKGTPATQPVTEEMITVILKPTPVIEPARVIPPPAPTAIPPAEKPQIRFVPPTVVNENHEIPEETNVPTTQQLQHEVIGTETISGDMNGTDPSLMDPVDAGGTGVVTEPAPAEPFVYVEQMPSFPGGMAAMYAFINSHIRYPEYARESNISGTVVLQFVISSEGTILDARVIRGIGASCDQEALRVINLMPRWNPGKHNGRVVPVKFTLPVKFVIR